MAEYAVQALALLGTDAALMSVDAAAIRYRTKNKNIGAAAQEAFAATAERLGLTVDELGDRVVPWLGFEPGKPRVIGADGKQIEVAIGPDFKLKFRDVQKNKPVASLPKSLPKETLAEFKEMAATLREVAKAAELRLETLMVRQSAGRWPAGASCSWPIRCYSCRSRPGWSGATMTTAVPCWARFGRWRTGRSPTRPMSLSSCPTAARSGSSIRWSWTTRRWAPGGRTWPITRSTRRFRSSSGPSCGPATRIAR